MVVYCLRQCHLRAALFEDIIYYIDYIVFRLGCGGQRTAAGSEKNIKVYLIINIAQVAKPWRLTEPAGEAVRFLVTLLSLCCSRCPLFPHSFPARSCSSVGPGSEHKSFSILLADFGQRFTGSRGGFPQDLR